jgi:excisionase family DNA binding protein
MKAGRRYLRAAEIAALTGMSLRTVRRWIKDEVLPSVKVGGARLVATEDLEALLSASCDTVQETSDDPEEYDDESEL